MITAKLWNGLSTNRKTPYPESRETPGTWYSAVDRYDAESPPNQIAGGKPSIVISRAARPRPNTAANRRCLPRADHAAAARLTTPNPATGPAPVRSGPPPVSLRCAAGERAAALGTSP